MAAPLTSARRYRAATRAALLLPAVCDACDVAIEDRERAKVTFSEDGTVAWWLCGECYDRQTDDMAEEAHAAMVEAAEERGYEAAMAREPVTFAARADGVPPW